MDKIRWGVLSTAKIARQFVIPATQRSQFGTVAAIASFYMPLPNHLHVQWSIRALEAGKHVLCEKPIGLSVAEAERLAGVAASHPKLKIMEAFMVRLPP